jgi:hypothetical protein
VVQPADPLATRLSADKGHIVKQKQTHASMTAGKKDLSSQTLQKQGPSKVALAALWQQHDQPSEALLTQNQHHPQAGRRQTTSTRKAT